MRTLCQVLFSYPQSSLAVECDNEEQHYCHNCCQNFWGKCLIKFPFRQVASKYSDLSLLHYYWGIILSLFPWHEEAAAMNSTHNTFITHLRWDRKEESLLAMYKSLIDIVSSNCSFLHYAQKHIFFGENFLHYRRVSWVCYITTV